MFGTLRQFRDSLGVPIAALTSTGRPHPSRSTRHALTLALLFTLPVLAHAQTRTTPLYGPPDSPRNTIDPTLPMNDASGRQDERLVKMLNAARQNSMISDAEKLLKLARELDAEIAASNSASLTPAQLRKVARIEKLAHSVRVGMSTVVRVDDPDQVSFPISK
jgi:hypothetical protein